MKQTPIRKHHRPHVARSGIRALKRSMSAGLQQDAPQDARTQAQEAALALLAHSIRRGHRRLSLLRLNEAMRVGANVTPDQWHYCTRIAQEDGNADNIQLFERAWRQYQTRPDGTLA